VNVRWKGLSGSTLKLIAIVSMLIDHVAAAVIVRVLYAGHWTEQLYQIYRVMRSVGRIAFPIFCFFLVEGFEHTRDRKKYALRLFLFALISEIPFDLAFSAEILEVQYQNVFFTLLIGLITVMAFHAAEEKKEWNPVVRVVLLALIVAAGMGIALFLKTDYDAKGVMAILLLYVFRKKRSMQILAGCLFFSWWELPALAAFFLLACYNGTRGLRMKYFFYVFYPAHLLLLYAVCLLMGTAGIPAV
jgi:hypothetical protein